MTEFFHIGRLRCYGEGHLRYARILGIHFWSHGITISFVWVRVSFAWMHKWWKP